MVCSLCNTVSDGLWSVERIEQLQASQRGVLISEGEKKKKEENTTTIESFSLKKIFKTFS